MKIPGHSFWENSRLHFRIGKLQWCSPKVHILSLLPDYYEELKRESLTYTELEFRASEYLWIERSEYPAETSIEALPDYLWGIDKRRTLRRTDEHASNYLWELKGFHNRRNRQRRSFQTTYEEWNTKGGLANAQIERAFRLPMRKLKMVAERRWSRHSQGFLIPMRNWKLFLFGGRLIPGAFRLPMRNWNLIIASRRFLICASRQPMRNWNERISHL
jgi:hypothetical protein